MGGSLDVVRRRIAWAWLLAALWAAVVWGLGTDGFSASRTAHMMRSLIAPLGIEMSYWEMYRLLVWVRKSAHVVAYGLLAFLVVRALWIGSLRQLVTSLGLTFALVGAFAIADEVRQGYSAVRTGSGLDVALDLAGAVLALAAVVALQRRFRRPLFAATDASANAATGAGSGNVGAP